MSSISTSVRAAGTAIATRMTTGTAVQMISTRVLCTMVVSATAPLDLRKVMIDQIIAPNTTTRDHDAHPEDQHVQVVDLAAHVRHALRHVEQAPARLGVRPGRAAARWPARAVAAWRQTCEFERIIISSRYTSWRAPLNGSGATRDPISKPTLLARDPAIRPRRPARKATH